MSENTGRDRVAGGNRGCIRLGSVHDKVKEVVHDRTVRAAVSADRRLDMIDDIRRGARTAAGPDMNIAVSAVTDIFDSAFRADESVVAFGIRRVMALEISRLSAVFHLHHDHVVIFHVDDRGKSGLFKRRVLGRIPFRASGRFGRTSAALVVNGEHTHTDNGLCIGSHQPVHDIDVMCAFLKKKTVGVALFGVPVTEIGVASVTDEVSCPADLDIADDAGLNDLSHLEDNGKVTHIVPDEQFGTGFHRSLEDAVATFDCDRHRLLKINRLARFQSVDRHFFMEIVGCGNENRTDFIHFQQFPVILENPGFREFFLEFLSGFRRNICAGNDRDTLFRLMRLPSVVTASAGRDKTHFQCFHFQKTPLIG